jgi:MFS family permease
MTDTADPTRAAGVPTGGSLFTTRFVLVVTAGLFYFTSLAMLTPVIPHYVEDELNGGSLAVGVAVGSFAFGAVVLRTYAGRLGDQIGRRILIVSGAGVVAVSTAAYGLVPSLWWILLMRLITGFGEAAFFVGAATMVTDLAPPNRRGEAVSYWSIAVYGGLSFGPALGEAVRGDDRYTAAWLVSAGFAAAAMVVGLMTREVERSAPPAEKGHLIHRAAVLPGTVLFLGLIPLAGFSAFMPLYAEDTLDIKAGPIFLLYGIIVLIVRIVGARLPDRVGARVSGTGALAFSGLGIAIIAIWPTVAGLIAGTIVFALGMSLMYPALLLMSLVGVPDNERASVVGTFSSFFDLSQGIGAPICGIAVLLAGDRGAFAAGAITAALGMFVLWRFGPSAERAAVARGRDPAVVPPENVA